jgi:GT2 family glycosyltransferase
MISPRVDVLVINWNGLEHLEDCFSSLLASTYENMRVVLVDNASDDGSVAFVEERFGHDPRVEVVVCPGNLGWSGGNNFALRRSLETGAEYALLINNDTATDADAIARLVDMAEARPEIGVLAPKMLLFHTPHLLNSLGLECTAIGSSWDIGLGRLDGPRWDEPKPAAGACGGAMLVRMDALRKTGLLPEEFEIYLDDLDLCLRIWNAGYEVWTCPAARVRHKFSATYGTGARARYKQYLNTRNRFWLVLRNFPLKHLPAVLPAMALGEVRAVGRALLDGAWWRVASHVRAWGAALTYLPAAWRERRRRARAGMGACRFWPLVRWRPQFCPGYVLPEQGWYPLVECHGELVHPISAEAEAVFPPGQLRVFHGNCYPSCGATGVELHGEGIPPLTLVSNRLETVTVEWPGGPLRLVSRRIFTAEETGALYDVGGWIRVEHAGQA